MIDREEKVIVVHSGKRDDYQVAKSLQLKNRLEVLVTDDYVIRYYLNREKDIPISKIRICYKALFWQAIYRVFNFQFCQIQKDQALSNLAARIANKTKLPLIAYSYYALPAFEILDDKIKKILFQLHPHPAYIKKLFVKEIQLVPSSQKSLSKEHELNTSSEHFDLLSKEAHHADIILCASTFTKLTLEAQKTKQPIYVIPYGVNLNQFPFIQRSTSSKKKHIQVLFVGSLNQRKGIYYLLEAVQVLQKKQLDVRLHIVGRGIFDKEILNEFDIHNLRVDYNVSFEKLIQAYQSADIFVLPSLCEGFGQVILEAMSTGLPIIASEHTSAVDVIDQGVQGFVVPIRDSQEIAKKIEYLLFHPQLCQEMGKAAFEKSRQFTWNKFSNSLLEILDENL